MEEANQQDQEKNGTRKTFPIQRRLSWRQMTEKQLDSKQETEVAPIEEEESNQELSEQDCREIEDLEEYIETVADEDIEHLLKHSELFKLFCSELLKAFQNFERKEAAFENLLKVVKKLSLKSDLLLDSVKTWLPQRKYLLNILKEDVKAMDVITKVCNTGRLVSSVIDTASLVGGLIIRKSNSSSASVAFDVANVFGVLGFAASAVEMYSWKSKIERLMKQFQDDQDLLAPIHEWFQTNNELEEAMKEIFPIGITKHIVREFDRAMHKQLNQAELLRMVLWPILQEDHQRVRDITLIRNLIAFIFCPAATDWCRWIVLRHHKASFDIEAMLLQLINPQRFAGSQNFAVTDRGSQGAIPIATVGRIGLNVMTMYDAVNTLRYSTMVEELTQLHGHLKEEMTALQQISKLLAIRN